MDLIWTILASGLAFWYFLLSYRLWVFVKGCEHLGDVNVDPAKTKWPKVSLIIPACNEASTVDQALSSLLKNQYPNLEVVIINDRSTDGTGEILAKWAKQDARVKAVEVKSLPEGWLGKVHALHTGVAEATGEWLLFSDADVHHKPNSLHKAIQHCENRNLDFLAVGPAFVTNTVALGMIQAQFFHQGCLAVDAKRIADPKRADVIGIGAFNLVRRSQYDRSRGLTALRMEVLDDGGLSWIIKESGGHLGFLSGLNELAIEWYKDLPALVRGLEKNGFAIFQYSLLGVMVYVVGSWLIVSATLMTVISASGASLWFLLIGIASYFCLSAYSIWKWMQISPLYALSLPISFLIFPLIILRSSLICLRQGGIRWRDSFYPLEVVKAGQVLLPIEMFMGSKPVTPRQSGSASA